MLLPGFAANEVLHHGSIDVRSDIYSFGKTFLYVLDKRNIKGIESIKRILNRCIQEHKENRYEDFNELNKVLLKLAKQHHRFIKKPIYYFLMGCIVVGIGFFFHNEYKVEQQHLYQIAITKKKYEEASYIYPEKIELYQLAYQQYYEKEVDKVSACLYLETLIERNKMMDNDEILSYFALQCMEADAMQCYQKAYYAFSNIKDMERKNPLYHGYKEIAYMLGFNENLNKKEVKQLVKTLQETIVLVDDIADIKDRYHHYEVLLNIYITRQSQLMMDSYIQEISLLNKMQSVIIENPMLEKDLNDIKIKQANVYYERGMWYYVHQKTNEMKQDFTMSLQLFSQQAMKQEDKHKIAIMKLYIFEFCMEPKVQKKSIYIVEEGIELLKSIPKMNKTETTIYQSLIQTYTQWRE